MRHELSCTSPANGTNTDVLSRQRPFRELSSSEQEELEAILDDDVREMKRQFGYLVTKTRDSLEDRVLVENFATSILALGAYEPAPEQRDHSLLDEHREEIMRAESISEIFNILSPYWNYLNHEILEYIIKLYGTSDDYKRMESYDEDLQNFCKRRIFELSLPESGSSNGNAMSPKQKNFSVKLNVCEDITCKELLRIRKRIAEVLHVKLAALIIVGADAGCVQLTFLIPTFVAQEIFPLSNEQMSVLHKDTSVIRLECGDYVFEVIENTVYIVLQSSFSSIKWLATMVSLSHLYLFHRMPVRPLLRNKSPCQKDWKTVVSYTVTSRISTGNVLRLWYMSCNFIHQSTHTLVKSIYEWSLYPSFVGI